MKKLSRRTFIYSAAAALGAAVGAFKLFNPQRPHKSDFRGQMVGGGRAKLQDKDIKYLVKLDMDAQNPVGKYLTLDFQPHGLARRPAAPNIVCVFEKKGPGACEVDLNTFKKLRDIATLPGRHFYGHGVYSSDAKLLYCTETVLETQEGLIVIRDADTLEIQGTFPTYGANPHECQLIDDGRVMVTTNGGGTKDSGLVACVTYVDVATQKLITKHEMKDERFNTGHFQISKDKKLVVISAPRDGLAETELGSISMVGSDDKLEAFTAPAEIVSKLKGETLSICIDEKRGQFAATSPKGNFISFWNLNTKKYISHIEMVNPRGVTMSVNDDYFIVSNDLDAGLVLVNAETLQLIQESRIAKAGFSGSHLYLS